MELWLDQINTPIGTILLVTDDVALWALDFAEKWQKLLQRLTAQYGEVVLKPAIAPHRCTSLIQDYFAGEYNALVRIPVRTSGTPFQQQVWSALRDIPPGTTLSYGALATRLGKPGAARAVGMANARNPVAIVVPCHRVIGGNATLTGYSGGLERKLWLLRHEGVELTALAKPCHGQAC